MHDHALDPRLLADTLPVAPLKLSQLRLILDRRWPWLVLVPAGRAVELFDLHDEGQRVLIQEVALVSRTLKSLTGAHKINVGALGNVVPQLHVHVVARSPGDPAWPGPVWGFGTRESYAAGEAEALAERVREAVTRS